MLSVSESWPRSRPSVMATGSHHSQCRSRHLVGASSGIIFAFQWTVIIAEIPIATINRELAVLSILGHCV